MWGSLGLDSRLVSWMYGSGLKVGYLGAWGSLGLDSRWVTWVRGAALVWTQGGLPGCVGQPGSGLKVGYLGAWGSLGLDSRSVTWVGGAAWTQGGFIGDGA